MTSTSTEPGTTRPGSAAGSPGRSGVVLRGIPADQLDAGKGTELRSGRWTRLGSDAVRGDAATEASLHDLAERTRAAARAEGYAVGWAEGRRRALADAAAAEQERTARREREHAAALAAQRDALAALADAVRHLEDAAEDARAQVAGHSIELALQIAEAVLGREIAVAADPGADALVRAFTALGTPVGEPVPATVRLHPDDRAALDAATLAELVGDQPVTVVSDSSLQRGDAVVATDSRTVDATVAAALDRVRAELQR